MKFRVNQNGFYFYGPIQELLHILANYPPQTTLLEFVRLNLN
ncbi:MAG: hypothetical protein VB084_01295 [Syntrophomonadaceae bacterium]|nr:hypothetical protein [Syntrophomonadaceae bacterium]